MSEIVFAAGEAKTGLREGDRVLVEYNGDFSTGTVQPYENTLRPYESFVRVRLDLGFPSLPWFDVDSAISTHSKITVLNRKPVEWPDKWGPFQMKNLGDGKSKWSVLYTTQNGPLCRYLFTRTELERLLATIPSMLERWDELSDQQIEEERERLF